MNKTCSKCQKSLDISMFWKDKYKKDGFRSACKICNANDKEYLRRYNIENAEKMRRYREKNKNKLSAASKKWRESNPERVKLLKQKNDLKKYGITLDEYDKLFEKQSGLCSICKLPETNNKKLSVDHDHNCCSDNAKSCGKCIRGLLCNNCNNMLGRAKDNIQILSNAILYLKEYGGKGYQERD